MLFFFSTVVGCRQITLGTTMEVCVELFTSVVLFMFDLSSSLRVLVRVVFTFGAKPT